MRSEYYIDNSLQFISKKNGSKNDPFSLFDDAINIFNNKSFLGDLTFILISHQNDESFYFSNEKIIQLKEGTHVFFER